MKIKKKAIEKKPKKKSSDETAITTQWTIRGISIEARSAAQKAAEKGNEFIGSWISRKLLEAAQADLTAKKEMARPEDVQDILIKMQSSFSEEISKLNHKLDKLSDKPSFLSRFLKK
jgi:hypothetical protein